MSTILVWKEQLQKLYAKYALIIDKVIKLILGLAVFGAINGNIGYMKVAASFLITIGLAAVCAFLPLTVMVLAATALILAHLSALSLAAMIVAAGVFVLMYIFYFRFTPKKAWLVLLTPVAFTFGNPYIVPLALGLIGTPISIVPIACGTIVYFMLHYVHTNSAALSSAGTDGLITSLTTFAKQTISNKEMWLMIAAFALCVLFVYAMRTRSVDHSWKIAIVLGAITNIVVIVAGAIALNIDRSAMGVIVGNIIAAAVGSLLEVMLFSVDYSRTERIQFEDDEYYYYVKAVPKLAVAVPQKRVSRITESKDTTMIDTENIKKVAQKQKVPSAKRRPASNGSGRRQDADEVLLRKSLEREAKRR